MARRLFLILFFLAVLLPGGCSVVYYGQFTWAAVTTRDLTQLFKAELLVWHVAFLVGIASAAYFSVQFLRLLRNPAANARRGDVIAAVLAVSGTLLFVWFVFSMAG